MGLDFSKKDTQTLPANSVVQNELEVVPQYDIVADREEMNRQLVNSPEVDADRKSVV